MTKEAAQKWLEQKRNEVRTYSQAHFRLYNEDNHAVVLRYSYDYKTVKLTVRAIICYTELVLWQAKGREDEK